MSLGAAGMSACITGSLAAFVVDGDFQSPQKLLILRGQLDLPHFATRGFGLRPQLNGFAFFALFGVLAFIEADGGFEDQEDVVTGALDFANGGCDAVGVGKRFVYRVSKFLHELLQFIFQVVPLSSASKPPRAP